MPQRLAQLPLQTRLAPITGVDAKTRIAHLVWTTGARVKRRNWVDWDRYEDYMEELSLAPGHVRMDRLNNGAPLLNAHNRWSVDDVIGVVESGTAKVDGKQGEADVRFSDRENVQPIFKDVEQRILRNVSTGYVIHKLEKLPPDDRSEGLPVWRAVDWEPMELSLVPIGADAGAGVRAEQQSQQRTYPCEIIDSPAVPANQRQEPGMNDEEKRAAEEAAKKREKEELERRTAAETKAREEAAAAEQARVQEIRTLVTKHGLEREFEDKLLAPAVTIEKARQMVLDKLAEKTEKTEIRGGFGQLYLAGDEIAAKRVAMAGALMHRVDPKAKLEDASRDFRYLSLREMARLCLEWGGVNTRHMSPMEIASRSLMAGGDFTNLLADVMGKRLRAAYVEQPPTYTQWARRAANAPDFKDIKPQVLSNAPDLQAVPAGAEFKTGVLTDGKETYAITTYGRIIGFTRQAIINDDLNAFERFPSAFAGSARRLENRTVYNQLLNNGNLADGIALFHASHGNLPSATTIDAANLGIARALMRKQKGLQQEELNLAPAFLMCGPDKEQLAYQFTSSQFTPATPSTVNEFRTGGRTAVTPVVDAVITGNKWFMAASNADIDTVEYCYLDGSEGVYLESRMGFTVDGVEMKSRLDFAAKAVDYRGLVYNSGA